MNYAFLLWQVSQVPSGELCILPMLIAASKAIITLP